MRGTDGYKTWYIQIGQAMGAAEPTETIIGPDGGKWNWSLDSGKLEWFPDFPIINKSFITSQSAATVCLESNRDALVRQALYLKEFFEEEAGRNCNNAVLAKAYLNHDAFGNGTGGVLEGIEYGFGRNSQGGVFHGQWAVDTAITAISWMIVAMEKGLGNDSKLDGMEFSDLMNAYRLEAYCGNRGYDANGTDGSKTDNENQLADLRTELGGTNATTYLTNTNTLKTLSDRLNAHPELIRALLYQIKSAEQFYANIDDILAHDWSVNAGSGNSTIDDRRRTATAIENDLNYVLNRWSNVMQSVTQQEGGAR
jgi:hypothetical protein